MKRLLIFSHAMELGGAEKALLGLLEAIDTKKYKVDLFLMRHEGELLSYIPEGINVLPEIPQYASLAVPISKVLKKGHFLVAYGRYMGKKKAKQKIEELNSSTDNDIGLQYSHLYTLPFMPPISNKKYDLAISFLTPHYFVAERVEAKKKVAWIHTDYSKVDIDANEQLKMWSRYDRIVSISKAVTLSFIEKFPELSQKIVEIGNIVPMTYLENMQEAFSAESEMPRDGCIRLLSIGRFCTAKNFDNVPDICKKLRTHGLNVKWYLIGYGADEKLIKKRIAESGMQDYVIILGKKENPYPYIKACELYVQPSRYEGKCVSVIEAQILDKPVVITNYATAASQLENGVDGIIVPQDNDKCAASIASLLGNQARINQLINNCKARDYSNVIEIDRINKIIDND